MDLQIDQLVKSTIETKIIEAFRSTPEMIDLLVKSALSMEVNQYGGKPDYSDREKMPYLTFLARDTIQGIARTAVIETLTEMAPAIKDQVKMSLAAENVVDAFTKQIIESGKQEWQINVSFSTDK